jgi:hypothetical protein
MTIDQSDQWVALDQTRAIDPHYIELYENEQKLNPPVEPKLTKPRESSHLWWGKLPPNLPVGTHLLRVKTTDMHGRVFQGHRSFRVVQ